MLPATSIDLILYILTCAALSLFISRRQISDNPLVSILDNGPEQWRATRLTYR